MPPILLHALIVVVTTYVSVLVLSMFLTYAARILGERATRAPLLDLWVALMTWVPWVIAGWRFGWIGWPAAIVGQMGALYSWCFIHEQMNKQALNGPRIVKFINRRIGRLHNHLALWVTLVALPAFWSIRFAEMFVYWTLPLLLKFPKYKQSEWINVSRQKFDGLIGHDLIWCLYCDWMTGVYSLGAEMLRNVESFWCPIRFYDGKKCDNCKIDFPDIEGGWVNRDGTMADVEKVMEEKYGGEGDRAWFGHPVRLTVKGQDVPKQRE